MYYLKHEKCIFGRGLLSQIRQIVRLPRLSHSDEEWECVGTEIMQGFARTQEHRDSHAWLQSSSHLGKLSLASKTTK